MIELRYKLEPPMPNKGREDRQTLQYRYLLVGLDPRQCGHLWSEWNDVGYFAEED